MAVEYEDLKPTSVNLRGASAAQVRLRLILGQEAIMTQGQNVVVVIMLGTSLHPFVLIFHESAELQVQEWEFKDESSGLIQGCHILCGRCCTRVYIILY